MVGWFVIRVGDKLLDTYCPSHCKAFLVLDHLYDILLICSRALYAGNVLLYSCERFAPGAFCFMTFIINFKNPLGSGPGRTLAFRWPRSLLR